MHLCFLMNGSWLLILKSTGHRGEGMLSSSREKSLGLRAVSQFFLYV